MKIEKLTENKIRVIINHDELDTNEKDINTIMSKAIESQELFLNILKKAEKEVNFYTDGCKLLIEAFSSLDDFCVFTITKFLSNKNNTKNKPVIRKKAFPRINKHAICSFEDFDTFCDFCNSIKNIHTNNYELLIHNSSLYLWKNCYYLILKNIDIKSKNSFFIYAMLSEFASNISISNSFESKLLEYGKVIIKKEAISTGIKFFNGT